MRCINFSAKFCCCNQLTCRCLEAINYEQTTNNNNRQLHLCSLPLRDMNHLASEFPRVAPPSFSLVSMSWEHAGL